MDAWFLQQRQREQELRQRRKEAAELLRGYRATTVDTGYGSGHKEGRYSLGTPSSLLSESLHDPAKMNLAYELDKEGEEKYDDEKKLDDPSSWQKRSIPSNDSLNPPQVTTSRSDDPPKLPETVWRDYISSQPGAKFPPESCRYHLYVSYACPGSHRALIVRALKDLQDVISVTFVHPTWRLTNPNNPEDKHRGWVFGDPHGKPFPNTIGRGGPFPSAYRDTEPDPIFNAYSIREIYERANDTSGKYTIPLLWDKKLKTIVNNESSDIAYMLNSCFNDFSTNPDLDLYTEADEDGRARLNEVSEWLAPLMIHGT
jgi:hypothetical protein